MPEIKTREAVKDIKVLDKASAVGEKMRSAYISTKGRAGHLIDDKQTSPSEYAEDQVQFAAEESAKDLIQDLGSVSLKTYDKAKRVIDSRSKEKISPEMPSEGEFWGDEKGYSNYPKVGYQGEEGKIAAFRRSPEGTSRADGSLKETDRRIKIKSSEKMKSDSGRSIKTSGKTIKSKIKVTENTAETSQKAAKAAERAAKRSAQRAKAISEAAKKSSKAVIAATKAAVKAMASLAEAIVAGGWISIVIIVVICLIGLILSSSFGIFFSSEESDGRPMNIAIQEINEEYLERIESIKESNEYDVLELSGSKAVWPEVLSVYAIKVAMDEDDPQEVVTLTAEKEEILREIFWEMNSISYDSVTEEIKKIIETDDGEGHIIEEEVTELQTTLLIQVDHRSAEEMAAELDFTDEQITQLNLLLDEKNAELWLAVLYGVYGKDEQIVAVALSQVGNVGGQPYWSWYGFSSRVEWCACFVSWCANECGYIENGIIPKFASCATGINWFKSRGQWTDGNITPVPGMLIFFDWDEPNGAAGPQDDVSDHVGIVERVENGRVYTIEGNSGDRCVKTSYPIGWYEIYGYGVPAY